MSKKQKFYDQKNRLVVAIDGPAGSGKGLIAQKLAELLGLKYVQSSIVYRGLAYLCLQENIALVDREAVTARSNQGDIIAATEGLDLSSEQVAAAASAISSIPKVRVNLGKYLQNLVKNENRIIMVLLIQIYIFKACAYYARALYSSKY